MRKLSTSSAMPFRRLGLTVLFLAILFGFNATARTFAVNASPEAGERLVVIHDRGIEKAVLTKASTVSEALAAAEISTHANDLVEPGLDEQLVANSYQVNIYRARPVVVNDGAMAQKILTAYQTPEQIAKHAGVILQDEDIASMSAPSDVLRTGAGLQIDIDRATAFTLVLYGKRMISYTQATTVDEMMKSKNITLGENDALSVKTDATIEPGMKIEIWRNGKQTITEEQDIAFPVEQIQDVNRKVGYRDVKTPGERGKKTVTYEVVMKNGKEKSRKEIQSVTTKKPKKQVEVVGTKPSFSGDFAAALAKLRSCEGGYSSWNPAGPYYGAYQFDRGTWSGVSNAPYGNASPAEQDAAAHALYQQRGWQPWPVCGAPLPDIYR